MDGGKFVVTLGHSKKMSSKFWEDLLLAVVGGQFHDVADDEICGIV